jgi:transcriptional regulator with XRE-family HTH domain
MEKRALAERFGALVRRLRLERGFSQEAYAQACGLERPHVGKIERGEINVTVATTLKLVHGLGLTLSVFFAELEKELGDTGGEDRRSAERSGSPGE